MSVPVVAEKAYQASIDNTTAEIAAELQNALGQKMMSFMLDVQPRTFGEWATGKASPRGKNNDALRHIAHIYNVLADVDDKHTIRLWFVGMNPMLDDDAPVEIIRDGQFKAALAAARSFRTTG